MSHAEHSTNDLFIRSQPLWQRMICGWARRISAGRLTLVFPDGQKFTATGREPGPSATLRLNSARPVWKLVNGGSLGFAEAYMDGDWESPEIADLLELALVNETRLRDVMKAPVFSRLFARFRHMLRRNTKTGSRRNIAFHYDLGNDFYSAWLDRTMTYSSALYRQEHLSLEAAQDAKYDRIIDDLGIGPDDHVLEIGCGWGGFAERAIARTGCKVTGLTLSTEQARFAIDRLEKAGLRDKADIRLEDYRDVKGQFSKIVSIEMFEAVGEENWPVYFKRVRELLAPGGKAMIQVITIDEETFDSYRRGADFIQTYIFPGGMLPSVTAFEQAAGKAELSVSDRLRFGRDYERTLLDWDRAFITNWSRIRPLGFDDRFHRMWRYYLHYCAAGFRTGRLDVVQFTLEKA